MIKATVDIYFALTPSSLSRMVIDGSVSLQDFTRILVVSVLYLVFMNLVCIFPAVRDEVQHLSIVGEMKRA